MNQDSRPGIIVVGASGHAKVVIDIIEHQGCYNIVGLVDTFKQPGAELMGYHVIGREDCIRDLLARGKIVGGIIAIGHNWVRCQMARGIQELAPDFAFVNAIHPSARIAREVTLGHGVAVMAGVSVNPGTQIGDFCFLNTNSSVDHDNILGEFSCLQPNAATGGNVRIGAFSAVSMGANIIHGVSIGSHTVIGAGATVVADIPDLVVAFGTPCRVIRRREPEDSYY
jgi:sugar O-acyltransferase (sialic acid O-acetyltransferase NeuD family)